MGMASVSDDGGGGSDEKSADGWRAEEAVAGNRRALEALRELVAYPFLYAHESRLLGLKVMCSRLLPPSDFVIVCYTFRLTIQLAFFSVPEGCCSTAPWHRKGTEFAIPRLNSQLYLLTLLDRLGVDQWVF